MAEIRGRLLLDQWESRIRKIDTDEVYQSSWVYLGRSGAVGRNGSTLRWILFLLLQWDPTAKVSDWIAAQTSFSVLCQKRELVPVLFPNVTRALASGQQQTPFDLTLTELTAAFTALIDTQDFDMKVCFLIDGLDEYDGDYDELAKLFGLATKSDRVKLLLSSRPIPACVYAFSGCPGLRLQDLTYDDIRFFADSELGQHPLMQQVERASPGATDDLVEGIVSKASGVFLWVSVVVKLLIRRLVAYDTLAELRQRLDELPEQLELLYSHMLRSMPKESRAQGSSFLQLMLKSSKTHGRFPMTILMLSFAEDQNYDRCFIDVPLENDEDWRLESTEGRLRSRCCGLLEVQDSLDEPKDKAARNVCVLHRTVIEYLEQPDNWREITSWTEGSNFNATKALLSSSLSEMKATLLPGENQSDRALPFRAVARILTMETTLELEGQNLCRTVFIPHIMTTLFLLWDEKDHGRRSRLADGLDFREQLATMAGFHCIEAQLRPLLDVCDGSALPQLKERRSRAQIAAHLLSEYADEIIVSARTLTARGIIGCRCDPNESVFLWNTSPRWWKHRYRPGMHDSRNAAWTVWEFLLHYINGTMDTGFNTLVNGGLTDTILDLIICMLELRADRDAIISLERKTSSSSSSRLQVISARELVESFFCAIWDTRCSSPQDTAELAVTMDNLAKKATRLQALFCDIQEETQLEAKEITRFSKQYPKRTQFQDKQKGVVANDKPNASDDKLPRTWIRVPWETHQYRKSTSPKASKHKIRFSAADVERRWLSTKRTDRFNLLTSADQELAKQASRQDLSAREQRIFFFQILKLPLDQQEKILQCGEALRNARESGVRQCN
jgi:hypothetical protein